MQLSLTPTRYAGKVRVTEPSWEGSIAQVALQAPQEFHRVEAPSFADLADARFSYFVEKVQRCSGVTMSGLTPPSPPQLLPAHSGDLMKQTAVFIPSYFDFVRVRNYMKRQDISFTQICE